MNESEEPAPASRAGDADGDASARPRRWWIPIAIAMLAVLAAAGLEWSEFWARAVLIRVVALAAIVLIVVWWILLGGARRSWWRRLAVVAAASVVLAVALPALFRIEGSADGSAVPRIVWRWAESGAAGSLPVVVPPGGDAAAGPARAAAVEGLADFPGFLGADRSGTLGRPVLETDWTASPPEEMWRIPVGKGWSGFAVSAETGLALTQEQRGIEECVTAYEVATGRLVWIHAHQALFSESMGGDGPRATPTLAGDLAFVQGATGRLDCLRLRDGSVVWSRNVLEDHDLGNLEYGKANSPLLVDDLVVVTGGAARRDSLIACRRDTGETVWTSGDDRAAYSSPEVAVLGGVRQIVVVNAESASGHAVDDGRQLWRFDWPGVFPKVAQPRFPGDDRVLLSASYGAGTFLVAVGPPDPAAGGLQPVRELWRSNRLKTKFSSAIVRDGFAYGLDEGSFACIDLADGSRVWKEARYGYGQNLLVGDTFLIQTERGPVVLARATPDAFEELARLPALDAKTWNPPALAGRFLLVRNDREAACFRVPTAPDEPGLP